MRKNTIKTTVKKIIGERGMVYKVASRTYHLKDLLNIPRNRRRIKHSLPAVVDMRNRYMGQRCFVIGNGPSLTPHDVSLLKDEITFGCNKIYLMYDKTDWRPTYYCAQDIRFIRNDADIINQVKSKKLIVLSETDKYPQIDDAIFVKLINSDVYHYAPLFSDDATNGVYTSYTVAYMCLQMAVYMGFKEIYLLGVDCHYGTMIDENGQMVRRGKVQDHFSENDQVDDQTGIPDILRSIWAYKAARQYADSHGIKIYNATRGGKLEVFERVDFDSLFAD